MTLTVDILRMWFRQFNDAYFAGDLPMPRLLLSKSRTRLGTMSCKRTKRLFKTVYSDYTIRISVYYEQSEREFQSTLLHEMIHLYITSHQIPDTSSHGKVFRSVMQQINRQYGWDITVSSSMRDHKVASIGSSASTYVVLAIVLASGERMLSVVSPRSARDIDMKASLVKTIADHRWYMTQDDYFRDFPKVRSLRARKVSREVYEEKTAAMQPLVLK